jgi:hypothetical protein
MIASRARPERMPGPTRVARLSIAGVALALLLAGSARAQEPDRSAMAEALFQAGRTLMAQGNYRDACAKLAESNRIEPKLGTLMNLALCHENAGSVASAWAEYLRAAAIAKHSGHTDHEEVASEHARALEPTLPRVTVDCELAPGERVTLDDEPLGSAAFGTAIPLDPGEHKINASAPGKVPFSRSFFARKGDVQHIHVPALQLPPPPIIEGRRLIVDHKDQDDPSKRTWGFVVGGLGVAMIGMGAAFGVSAFSHKGTVESDCNTAYCTQAGLDAIQALKTSEAVSTSAIGAGLLSLGMGVYLVASSGGRSTASARATVSASPRGLGLGVTF